MAKKNMPGTSKLRSVSRPAQGRGRRTVIAGRPVGLTAMAVTPRKNAGRTRTGPLDAS